MPESLFERMSDAQAPRRFVAVDPGPRFKIEPPADAEATYRGWIVWYDWGDFEHGICYRETKWRASSRAGELVEAPPGETGDLAWLKGEIDRREKA